MLGILDELDDVAVAYLDDIFLFGDHLNKLWEAAVKVTYKLTTAGFLLSIN